MIQMYMEIFVMKLSYFVPGLLILILELKKCYKAFSIENSQGKVSQNHMLSFFLKDEIFITIFKWCDDELHNDD